MNTEQTSNIPATGFATIDTQNEQARKLVAFNLLARFSFSYFSARQLILGAGLNNVAMLNKAQQVVLSHLAVYAMSIEGEQVEPLQLYRGDVQILRLWLESRMAHCEEERDARVTVRDGAGVHVVGKLDFNSQAIEPATDLKFNPDTYIAMKFLLLDIREWLAGDIIED